MFDCQDHAHMAHALRLARCGLYSARPNPRVGCVIVQAGRVVGEGFHYRAGEAHAEVAALRGAGAAAKGATAYVTLEPCSHFGRTPPCADALHKAGIGRVVYAGQDPNPRVAGGGAARLAAAGIACAGGLMASEARELNRGFFMRCEHLRPFITVKLGMSLDGKVALANGQSQWITGPDARADVQRLRAAAGAILTGSGTLMADDPLLNVRDLRFDIGGRPPPRLIVDSRLRTPPHARLFEVPGEVRIFTERSVTSLEAERLRARGAIIETTPGDAQGIVLAAVMRRLGELEINDVLVEAGPTLVSSLLAAGFVDELVLYIAPVILGAQARNAFAWPVLSNLAEAPRCTIIDTIRVGADQRVTMRLPSP